MSLSYLHNLMHYC